LSRRFLRQSHFSATVWTGLYKLSNCYYDIIIIIVIIVIVIIIRSICDFGGVPGSLGHTLVASLHKLLTLCW